MIKTVRFRFISLLALVLMPIVIQVTTADVAEPEAIESLANWDNAQQLTNSQDSPNGAQRPVLASAPNGDLIVVYLKQLSSNELDADPYFRRSTDDGKTWSAPAKIYASTAFSRQVHVAFDNNSKAHAVWTENDNQIWYGSENVWASNGAKQLFSTADILMESPKIVVSNDGVLHLVWSQVSFSGQNVYYSQSTNGGTTWSTPVNVSNSGGASESPSIAVDSSNKPSIVWEEQVGGSEYKINFAQRNSSGVWNTASGISDLITVLTSAREPDIVITNNHIFVTFENRVSQSQQTLYYLECATNCTANPLTSNAWQFRLASVQAFGAKDSDPTFLVPKIVSVSGCRVIFFSGITGSISTNNERVRLANSCSAFSSNPSIGTIDSSLGANDRAIKPSATVLNNWFVFVAYERKGTTRSDVFIVRNQPALYLPIIRK